MSRKPYPDYKPSGVQWLGDIPINWNFKPIKALFTKKSDKNHIELPLMSVYRDYGVIPTDSRDDNYNKPSLDLSAYQKIVPTDLVTNKMKTWQGSIAISEYEE
jgi:type I restriction enzyme S subunit